MSDLDDLERRARTDGAAALSLAEARLMGDGGEPDAAAALALVEQGARLGNADARRAWVYMTAAGIGRPADLDAAKAMLAELAAEDRFAAVQLAFLGHVTCSDRLAAGGGRQPVGRSAHHHPSRPLQRRRMPLSDAARDAVAGASDGDRRGHRRGSARFDPRCRYVELSAAGRGSGGAGNQRLHRGGERAPTRRGASR